MTRINPVTVATNAEMEALHTGATELGYAILQNVIVYLSDRPWYCLQHSAHPEGRTGEFWKGEK